MFLISKNSQFCITHLMDQVLHADDAELAQGALNEVVGGDWGAVAVDLDGESFDFLEEKITDLCNKNFGFCIKLFPDITPMMAWAM